MEVVDNIPEDFLYDTLKSQAVSSSTAVPGPNGQVASSPSTSPGPNGQADLSSSTVTGHRPTASRRWWSAGGTAGQPLGFSASNFLSMAVATFSGRG